MLDLAGAVPFIGMAERGLREPSAVLSKRVVRGVLHDRLWGLVERGESESIYS